LIGIELESYTYEPRIIHGLFLVATKCDEPFLRRQAINLLKSSHRREGMRDSIASAERAEWITGLETQGLKEGQKIPEHSRVFGEKLELDVENTSKVVARCSQTTESGNLREYYKAFYFKGLHRDWRFGDP
jgi:hypothetical protein